MCRISCRTWSSPPLKNQYTVSIAAGPMRTVTLVRPPCGPPSACPFSASSRYPVCIDHRPQLGGARGHRFRRRAAGHRQRRAVGVGSGCPFVAAIVAACGGALLGPDHLSAPTFGGGQPRRQVLAPNIEQPLGAAVGLQHRDGRPAPGRA